MYFKLRSGSNIFIQNKAFQFMFVIFFISIALGLYDGIISIYLNNLLENPSLVGFVSALMVMIMFFTYLFLTQMYSKYPVTHVWIVSTLLMGFSLFLLYFFQNVIAFAILIGIAIISLTLYHNTSAIILRHSTTLETIGKIQSYNYVIRNIGWILGPLLSSFILYKFGLLNNFLLIGLFIFIGWLLFLYYQIKAYEEKKSQTINLKTIRQSIVEYFENKELLKLYFIRGFLSFYWAIIYLFTPLYVLSKSLPLNVVGIYLGMIAVPLIITEFLLAKKIDVVLKKKLFLTGGIIIFSSFVLAFIFTNIYISLFFILLSSIGAAFLEPTCETYFFNNVNKSIADRYYGVYRTSDSLFSLTSRLFFGFVLLFLEIRFVYLITGILFLIMIYIASKVSN